MGVWVLFIIQKYTDGELSSVKTNFVIFGDFGGVAVMHS